MAEAVVVSHLSVEFALFFPDEEEEGAEEHSAEVGEVGYA